MRKVVIQKRLVGEEINLGIGATILLDRATPPIVKFIRMKYNEDPDCIEGDIRFLFSFDGEGLQGKYKYHV